MKRLTQSLIAIACLSAGSFSMNVNALTWQQAETLPKALAQAEVVSTTGCKAFKTPGMNQAVNNLRIWKEDIDHPLVNNNYRIAKKSQKREMSVIKWNSDKCAQWDKDFANVANALAAQGYGSKVTLKKPSKNSKIEKFESRMVDDWYVAGFYSKYVQRCGVRQNEVSPLERRLGSNVNYSSRDRGYWNADELYDDMGEQFCTHFKYIEDKAK